MSSLFMGGMEIYGGFTDINDLRNQLGLTQADLSDEQAMRIMLDDEKATNENNEKIINNKLNKLELENREYQNKNRLLEQQQQERREQERREQERREQERREQDNQNIKSQFILPRNIIISPRDNYTADVLLNDIYGQRLEVSKLLEASKLLENLKTNNPRGPFAPDINYEKSKPKQALKQARTKSKSKSKQAPKQARTKSKSKSKQAPKQARKKSKSRKK